MLRYFYSLAAVTAGLLCLPLPQAQAQTFQPGYVIAATGDTVRGELENGFWQDAPATIRFRPQPQAAIQTLFTRSLQEFGLSGLRTWRRQYLTYDAAAESNPANVQADAPRTRFVTDTLVTEILVQGPITLSAAFKGTTPHYFLQRAGQTPLELVERRYQYTGPDGRHYLSKVNDYREQLRGFLPDCPTQAPLLNKLPYDEKALIKLVQLYNTSCLGQPAPVTQAPDQRPKSQNRIRLDWGVQAGAAYTSTRARDGKSAEELSGTINVPQQEYVLVAVEKRYLKNARLEQSLRPVAGIYADILFPGRRFALHTEGSIRAMRRYQQEYATDQAGYPRKTYQLDGWQTTLLVGARGFRPLQSGNILVGAGLVMAFTALQQNEGVYPDATSLSYKPRATRLDYPLEQVGAYAEAGYRFRRFTTTLSWRYQEGLLKDKTAVEAVVVARTTNAATLFINSEYHLRSQSALLTIAYRLNRDTDQ